jgi:hypothetical protein
VHCIYLRDVFRDPGTIKIEKLNWRARDMAWVKVSCPDGIFEMDVDGVTRILRSYAYASALKGNSKITTESHIIGPDLDTVATDWSQVKKDREVTASQMATDFYLKMSTGLEGKKGIEYLEKLIDDRDAFTDMVHDLQTTAGQNTMNNIEASVKRGEFGEKVFTVIRDACAETELVLATGGGAALGLAGEATVLGVDLGLSSGAVSALGITAGSVMKGGFKWQDTRSFGQGVAEASIELVINLFTFGIGTQIPKGEVGEKAARTLIALVFGGEMKGALKMLPSSFASPKDLADGRKKSAGELLIPAGANIPSSVARQMMEALLQNQAWAVPATVAFKLALRYGAAALAKPAQPKAAGNTQQVLTPQRGVIRDLAAMGRTSLNCTLVDGLIDCSNLEEEFVKECALRPLGTA